MKRIKEFVLLISIFLLIGCSSVNTNMKINKDKSMILSYRILLDKKYLGNKTFSQIFSKEHINDLKNNGYEVKEYEDDNSYGYEIKANIEDIDTISQNEPITINLLEILDSNVANELYLFERSESFLKNKYTADFHINLTNLIKNNPEFMKEVSSTPALSYSFQLELPNEVINANATSISEDKKTLIWKYDNIYGMDNKISFTFESYNQPMLYVLYVAIGLGILIIISTIIRFLNWIKETKERNRKNRYLKAQMKMNKNS